MTLSLASATTVDLFVCLKIFALTCFLCYVVDNDGSESSKHPVGVMYHASKASRGDPSTFW